MIYDNMPADAVNSFHQFLHLLRKLRVIGIVKTNTEQVHMTEMGKPLRYKIVYEGYDPSMKGRHTATEGLELFFSKIHELAFDDTGSEPLGSCRQHE